MRHSKRCWHCTHPVGYWTTATVAVVWLVLTAACGPVAFLALLPLPVMYVSYAGRRIRGGKR